ncbi:MAG: thymidine kinase [Candidatus Brocadiaceae bacterium]|nr:thymidine kinase [Candidatus Brocadiaceae bacterium]
MAKLIFNHAVMAAGKSATLIQKAYQFRRNGQRVVVLQPQVDTRGSEGKVESRLGISTEALCIAPEDVIREQFDVSEVDIILIDEVNFFTEDQIEELSDIVDYDKVQCICYGILSDFKGDLFNASKRLVELADRLDEQVSMCEMGNGCNKKATLHVRLSSDTAQIVCGDSIYKSVCRKCWKMFNNK